MDSAVRSGGVPGLVLALQRQERARDHPIRNVNVYHSRAGAINHLHLYREPRPIKIGHFHVTSSSVGGAAAAAGHHQCVDPHIADARNGRGGLAVAVESKLERDADVSIGVRRREVPRLARRKSRLGQNLADVLVQLQQAFEVILVAELAQARRNSDLNRSCSEVYHGHRHGERQGPQHARLVGADLRLRVARHALAAEDPSPLRQRWGRGDPPSLGAATASTIARWQYFSAVPACAASSRSCSPPSGTPLFAWVSSLLPVVLWGLSVTSPSLLPC